MNRIKVILLVGKDEFTKIMFNGIKDQFDIVKVIVEEPVSKKILLKGRVKRIGLIKVIGQAFFIFYNKLWLRKKSLNRINEIKKELSLNDANIDESIIVEVNSVNDKETMRLLRDFQADVIVVNGTRIIKKEILESIETPFINTHSGITPKYRGVHGGYWALTENDLENCGVTIHLVDSGIDTGGILYQGYIKHTIKDNFNTYPYLQIAVAIPLMCQAIKDVSEKNYVIKETGLTSKLWSHPTIFEYINYRIFKGVK
tara:strand:+ start:2000 stop:2770 length:771 start_codon:yes stop_codon:yes gene_type:complete